MKRYLLNILCLVFVVLVSDYTLVAQDTARDDAGQEEGGRKIFHNKSGFVDSMQSDSLKEELRNPFLLVNKLKMNPKVLDPFDPFNHESYKRIGVGKFWYFVIVVLALAVFVYYRRYFGKQFALRLQSLIYYYYYRDLISETSISFTTGSIIAIIFSNLVFAQLLVLITIYLKFFSLNHFVYFIFIFMGIMLWKIFIYSLQKFQAYILGKEQVLRNFTQRHINIDLVMAMVMLPVLLLIYYNGNYFHRESMVLILSGILGFWISLRMVIELFGIFLDRDVSFLTILYFCGLEMLPHGLLFTALVRNYI